MTILALGETLEELDEEQAAALRGESVCAENPEEVREAAPTRGRKRSMVVLADTAEAARAMELTDMVYEGDIDLTEVGFCKIETQQECLAGSLNIPKLLDVLGSRYKIQFFINRNHIVIVNDDGFARRLVLRIRHQKNRQGKTRERFLFNFFSLMIVRDVELLSRYEQNLMELEEEIMSQKLGSFQSEIMPVRRELLTLRGYYDELMDMGRELEENENCFFAKKQLKYFGTLSDRADRLMGKTTYLLEYAQQVRDAYQAQVDARQNSNMQFLTVISTIFFPLTLITGWYGMNFQNMPELKNGYPWVIGLSLFVVAVCILIFKKKKMF